MKIINNPELIKEYSKRSEVIELIGKDLVPYLELYKFDKGEYLIKEGIVSKYLYILMIGKLKILKHSNSGKDLIYGFYNSVRLVGEISSIWQEEPSVNVIANEDVYCLAIDLEQNRDDLLKDSDFLVKLCKDLSNRVVTLDNLLANHVTIPVDSRVADYIIKHTKIDNYIDLNLSEASDSMFISYRHLLRTIGFFIESEYIIKKGKKYYVNNIDALNELAADIYEFDYVS